MQISASAAETSAPTLTAVDAELGARYKTLVAVQPLMYDIIPEGQLQSSHRLTGIFPSALRNPPQADAEVPMDEHKGNDL